MTYTSRNGASYRGQRLSRWFWGGFFAILLIGILLVVFASIRGGKQWLEATLTGSAGPPAAWTEVIRVTLSGGEAIYIDRAQLPRIQSSMQSWIEHRQIEARYRLLTRLDQDTDAIFQEASRHVPAFADWYYSLRGEYTRLLTALFGNLPELLSQQLNHLVFEPAGTTDAIDSLASNLDARLAEELREVTRDVQTRLVRLIRKHGLAQEDVKVHVTGQWSLGTQLAAQLDTVVSLQPQDMARQGAATSAGVAASAVTAKKLGAVTVAKASTKIASTKSLGALGSVAAKVGLKSAAKAGGSLGGAGVGAASGAALCAGTVAGAPLAPGCAVLGGAVTGLATWLLVDKAVLEAEELLNREELEEELRQALLTQRDELHATLKTRYFGKIESGYDQLKRAFVTQVQPKDTLPRKDFVPAHAAQQD